MPQQLSPYHVIAAEFFIVIKKKIKKSINFLLCYWIFSGIINHQPMLAYSLFWSVLLKINYYPNTCTLSCLLVRHFALGPSTWRFQCLPILLRFEGTLLS